VIRRADERVIGDVGFLGPPDATGAVSVGCAITEDARRRGYATEALSALLGWAREQPGLTCVVADTTRTNVAREGVAAVEAAVAGDDPGPAQLEQDVLEELPRDALRVGQPLGGDLLAAARGCQLDERPHRIVHLGRDPHADIVAFVLTAARSATLHVGERGRPAPLLVARRGARRRAARARPPDDR